jgi:hypothetical protein
LIINQLYIYLLICGKSCIFVYMRINKRITRRLLYELALEYDVRLHFTNQDNSIHGSARYWNKSISINAKQSGISMLSTFFHEVGHVHCWKNKIWTSFHVDKPIIHLTASEKRLYMLTALKAERWVDRWAKKEMKKHFPRKHYIESYLSEKSGKEFTQSVKKYLYE